MQIYPADILINIINITVLFLLLRRILWKPINGFLSARTERIRLELENASMTNAEAEGLKQEYAQRMEGIEARGRELMRESQTKAAEEAEEIIRDAKAEGEHLLHDARERIAEEKERAVIRARNEVAQLATDMAARILKREVSLEDSKSAVSDFFNETR